MALEGGLVAPGRRIFGAEVPRRRIGGPRKDWWSQEENWWPQQEGWWPQQEDLLPRKEDWWPRKEDWWPQEDFFAQEGGFLVPTLFAGLEPLGAHPAGGAAPGPHPAIEMLPEVLCLPAEVAEELGDALALTLAQPGFLSIPEVKTKVWGCLVEQGWRKMERREGSAEGKRRNGAKQPKV